MGAELCAEILDGTLSGDKVRIAFDQIVAHALYDHGHAGYSGTFAEVTEGVRIHTEIHHNKKYAYSHLDTIVEKWECAHAVRYLDNEGKRQWLIMAMCSC